MFNFTVKEETGYMFVTTSILKLKRYLELNNTPRDIDFKVEVMRDYQAQYIDAPFELSAKFETSFKSMESTSWSHRGKIELPGELGVDMEDAINVFIYDLMNSLVFSLSPKLRKLIFNTCMTDTFGDINFNIFDNNGEIVFSTKGISNPMKLSSELMHVFIIFMMITEQPLVFKPEVLVKSGYLDKDS